MEILLSILSMIAIYGLTILTNIVLLFFCCLLHSKNKDYDKDEFNEFKEHWEKEFNYAIKQTPLIFLPLINFFGTVFLLGYFIYSFFMFLFMRSLKILTKNLGQKKTITELLSDLFF